MAFANINKSIANRRITRWATATKQALQQEIVLKGIKHRASSPSPTAAINSIQQKTRSDRFGLINRVGYVIPRHMVYVHKGVGRGTTIDQVGQTTRRPKEWFNPVVARRINELADIVAEELGDAFINNLLIK
jgi:hypothetical protein